MNDFTATGVRLSSPDDVLTAIPYLLGFVPDHCLVVLALNDQRCLEVTARLDLPSVAEAPEAADCLVQALSRTSTRELIVVGYGTADDEVTATLTALADRLPWPVRELLRVEAGTHWWSLTCGDPHCCAPGSPLAANTRVGAELLLAAGSPAASRRDRAACLQAAADELIDRVRADLDRPARTTPAENFAALTRARLARRDRRAAIPAAEAAVLLRGLRSVTVRDACCGWRDLAALNLWQDLLPLAPGGWVAPVATLLALTAYQRGDGALAVMALERGASDDPDYSLAALVDQMLGLGVPPAEATAVLQNALQTNPLLTGFSEFSGVSEFTDPGQE